QTLKSVFTIFLLAILSPLAITQERLNAKQAIDVCKQKIHQAYGNSAEIRFRHNPASSIKGSSYTFWINATEEIAGDQSSIKYQCEITRTGELVELTREPGRWRI
ncbi:MAG: hypothetical protein RLN82_03595, partial [Pseudomonadales bacterium]